MLGTYVLKPLYVSHQRKHSSCLIEGSESIGLQDGWAHALCSATLKVLNMVTESEKENLNSVNCGASLR